MRTTAAAPPSRNPQLLLTMHRRERSRAQTRALLTSLRGYLDANPQVALTCPLHLRPEARDELAAVLGDHPRVSLTAPMGYSAFVGLLRDSTCVLTDSGGVQEEAAYLRKPVVLLRERTERRDGIGSGRVRLVGNDATLLPVVLHELMQSAPEQPASVMANASPSRRIAELIVARRAA
jgi:UDP-N-acetylglucosamine 2-epimerase (non-hydrolysing)